MEPTPDECAAFTSVKDLAEWAKVKDAVLSEFYAITGLDEDDHWRVVAGFAADDWAALVSNLKMPDGTSAPPAQMSKLGIMGACGRIVAGTQLRLADERIDYLNQQTIQLQAAQVSAGGVNQKTHGPVAASKPPSGTVALSSVIDQYNDSVVPMLTANDLKAGYAKYVKRLGAMPEPKDDVKLKQFSGLHGLFEIGTAPYVDLGSTFGPYGLRLEKKAKFQGLAMSKDGKLKPVEVLGPATFASYKECYAPYRTGCIMLDVLDPATLDAYLAHLESYVLRYGAAAWPIICQADLHARTENIERVRRACKAEYDMAVQMGACGNGGVRPHPFSRR